MVVHAGEPGREAGRRRTGEAAAGFDPATLRRFRRVRGLTLDALGALSRCSRASLIAYEKGRRRPGLETLHALAAALECEVEALAPSCSGPASYADLRRRAGLTKTEVASRLAMSRRAWEAIERGVREPSRELASQVARCLDASTAQGPAPRAAAGPEGWTARHQRVLTPRPTPTTPESLGEHPPVDTFIGRVAQLRELHGVLGSARLVTLVGAPGVGKTRLALQLGREAPRDRWEAVRFVPLAGTGDGELVPQVAAAALRISERRGRSLTDALCSVLSGRRVLLILDNCEHVVPAAAELAGRLRRACPHLSILATSQCPLGVEGERLWSVPPLETPGTDALPGASCDTESVRLFVHVASAHRRGFSLTSGVEPAVAEICRRLEGIPLAIQLAAARINVLTPGEILARLGDPMSLLASGADAGRRGSLQGALDWSYGLLPAGERALLRRLSVFASGCGIDAVEAVCGDPEPGAPSLLDSLATLDSKSLVIADTSGQRARYRLLEPVREYAAARAEEAGETEELRVRHLRWCADLAEAADAGLVSAGQVDWLERVDVEHDNLRAALRWAIAHGETRDALRLAAGLTIFWRVRGFFGEGRDWLRSALEMPVAQESEITAAALRGLGFLSFMVQETAAAIPVLERALELSRAEGDVRGEARALLLLGNARAITDATGTAQHFADSAALAREAGDVWCLGHALAMEALSRRRLGQREAAAELLDECVATARAAGELQSLRIGLFLQGTMARSSGDLDAAETLLSEGLSITRLLGEPFDTAWTLQLLGEIAIARGRPEVARQHLSEALALARNTGDPDSVSRILAALGWVAVAEGDGSTARLRFGESLAVVGASDPNANLAAAAGLGEAAMLEGDVAAARAILLATLERARVATDLRVVARCLANLGELSRRRGNLRAADERLREALRIRGELGDPHDIANSLELLATLSADCPRWGEVAWLLGAAQGVRDRVRSRRSPHGQAVFDRCRRAAEAAMGRRGFAADWGRGASMSTVQAVTAAQGRGPARSTTGWSSLTPAEQRVAELVVDGLGNAEIAERLFLTRSTVEGHLSNVFGKLGLRSRAQLIREGVARQLAAAD